MKPTFKDQNIVRNSDKTYCHYIWFFMMELFLFDFIFLILILCVIGFSSTWCICLFIITTLAATTLTGMHFATTTLMTVVLRWLGYIQASHLPFSELLKFILFANFSIVGMNVSLMWNSVGFYQVSVGNVLLPCYYYVL